MKKIIFYSLLCFAAIGCKQEKVSPNRVTFSVMEFGTDLPIPNARLLFYKTNFIGNGPVFQLIDSAITNDVGSYSLIETAGIDCVSVWADDQDYYFDLSEVLCGLDGRTNHSFRLRSKAQLGFSLIDDPNIQTSLNHVDVRIERGFQNRTLESTLFPNTNCDSLFVFANEPVSVELKRVYDSGASTYEYLTLTPLIKNEFHQISLTY
jgi:hypothetical protein